MALEGTELETVSAQLSKELEQMTLPVLEKLETATSTGESFDNREIKVCATLSAHIFPLLTFACWIIFHVILKSVEFFPKSKFV